MFVFRNVLKQGFTTYSEKLKFDMELHYNFWGFKGILNGFIGGGLII